jgi:hypothetical protein
MGGGRVRAAVMALASVLAGCAPSTFQVVRQDSARDFACASHQIVVTDATPLLDRLVPRWHIGFHRRGTDDQQGTFRADGCGRTATYACDDWDVDGPVCRRSEQ